jgi:hypothetical protein
VNSYIPVKIIINEHAYPARLYGDKIVSSDAGFILNRSDITTFKFDWLRQKIHLYNGNGHFVTNYNKIILSWFDPLFFIRLFTISIFVFSPLVGGVVLSRSITSLAFIPVSIFSGLLGLCFFKITRPDAVHSVLKIFLLLLVVCLPVIYWNPYFVSVFVSAQTVIFVLFLTFLAYSKVFNTRKYFISISWLIILVFYYFWLISIFQTMALFQTFQKTRIPVELTKDNQTLVLKNTLWTKPLDWEIKPNNFIITIFQRRNLLWSFSPYPASHVISTDLLGDIGWVSYIPETPEVIFANITKQLLVQKKILLAEILENDIKKRFDIKGLKGIFESFSYYDMKERRLFKVLLIIRPDYGNKDSVVFAIKIPASSSVNYYFDLVKDGFSRGNL